MELKWECKLRIVVFEENIGGHEKKLLSKILFNTPL